MAIAYDASSTDQFLDETSISFAHTCTGSDIVLIAFIYNDTTAQSVSTLTYNGVAFTRIATVTQGTDIEIEAWYLVNPATGSNTVALTLSGVSNGGISVTSYTGVNTTSPIFSYSTNSGTSEPTTLTIQNAFKDGNWIVDGTAVGDSVGGGGAAMSAITTTTNQTERLDFECGAYTRGLSSTKPVIEALTKTMGWDVTGFTIFQAFASIGIVLAAPHGSNINKLRPKIFAPGHAR